MWFIAKRVPRWTTLAEADPSPPPGRRNSCFITGDCVGFRRLVTGYTHFKDDPRIINLRASVSEYNRKLRMLNLRDHQVEYAKFSIVKVIFTLLYRTLKLAKARSKFV